MQDLYALTDIGPNEDAKGWAFRIVHYGLVGASVGLILLILLVLINLVLAFYIIQLRRDIKKISTLKGDTARRFLPEVSKPTDVHGPGKI